jgi:phage head maturation protease
MTRLARRDNDELRSVEVSQTFAIRDAETGDGRTIEGIAVPYGEPVRGATAEFGLAVESFAPGAFRDAIASVARGERIPIVDRHDGEVVGYADRLWDSPEGLRYSGRLLGIDAARDFAARVAERVMRVSIEFLPGEIRRAANAVTHTRVRLLGAIAGSYRPAYAGATASIRDIGGHPTMHCQHCGAELVANTPCPCTGATAEREALARRDAIAQAGVSRVVDITPESIQALATSAAEEYMRAWSERNMGGFQTTEDPFADLRGYRTLGHLVQAAIAVDAPVELRAWAARALAARTLADQLTTDSNQGVLTPGVLSEVHGIVSRGRPAITAFGGPRPLLGTGMSVDWPYFDGTLSSLIGAQGTEKTEITSAKVQIKKGTEPIQTFAGGSDISYQLLRRSTPSYLEVYTRILLTAYGVVTDAAFVAELESGSVTGDFTEALSTVDATELKNLLIDAAVAVQTATGIPAEFVLASTTAFTAAAKLLTPVTSQPAQAGIGVVDLRSLQVNVGLLPIIHVPSLTAGKFIASNREAAAWFEDGPFQATDEDVAKLGRNVAIWGMGAPARFIPAGIIEIYDVTP